MPYITKERRDNFEAPLRILVDRINSDCPGELNYIISYLLNSIIRRHLVKSYSWLSQWRAAINDASDEFYRRVIGPYENEKRKENGDVYDDVFDV